MRLYWLIALALLMVAPLAGTADPGSATQDFLARSFPDGVPAAQALWLTGERRQAVTRLLGHPPPSLRVRYWREGDRSAWVLEEIGKERPITTGIVVEHGEISALEILVYRESRGGEVQEPFFTKQFRGAGLDADKQLNQSIDSISGATLSVGAVKRLAREALYLAGQLPNKDEQ